MTPTLHQIHQAVNIHFGFDNDDIFKVTRKVKYAEPRQVFHYLAVTLTKYKLKEIANYKRKMDHSTVISSVKRVKGYLEVDNSYKNKVDDVKNILELQTPEYLVEMWLRNNYPELEASKIVPLLVKFRGDLESEHLR